ncbi:MAG: PEP-CTERM sorting domain-containing protein [Hyphomicrobiales bacterium]|nr:PEP-CTERM sorting domain-containing protein [Hyphomicrobiales bacterium]
MAGKRALSRGLAVAAISVGLTAALATGARAGEWEFTLHGVFNGTTTNPATGTGKPVITDTISGTGAPTLTANEPFTLTGIFNSSNVVFDVFSGFNAYAPRSVTLSIGGQTFSVETYGQNSISGFTVALFDKTSMFSVEPNGSHHVAGGFLANPPADGAGIITDFTNSNPNFPVTGLVNAVYPATNYFGVGFGSGPCGPPGPGPGGVCLDGMPNTVVPIPLDGGLYALTLGTYDLNNPANLGLTGFPPGFFVNPNSNLFSASLTSVPEPSTWALLLVGFAGLAFASLRSGRKAALAG